MWNERTPRNELKQSGYQDSERLMTPSRGKASPPQTSIIPQRTHFNPVMDTRVPASARVRTGLPGSNAWQIFTFTDVLCLEDVPL